MTFPLCFIFYINDYYMKKVFKVLSYYKIPVMMDLKQLDITGNKYFSINDLNQVLAENKELPFILECSLKSSLGI